MRGFSAPAGNGWRFFALWHLFAVGIDLAQGGETRGFYAVSSTIQSGGSTMRDARPIDAQLFQPDIPMRLDMRTAALVEHALALQEMAGTGAAALFLHCHDVPLPTALRVLTTGPPSLEHDVAFTLPVCPPASAHGRPGARLAATGALTNPVPSPQPIN